MSDNYNEAMALSAESLRDLAALPRLDHGARMEKLLIAQIATTSAAAFAQRETNDLLRELIAQTGARA